MMAMAMLDLIVSSKRMLTAEICQFELCHRDNEPLPNFTVGAHIKVETPSGAIRSYSLNNDETDFDRYVISVKRETDGRGGSVSMHERVYVGDRVRVHPPSNSLPLIAANSYLLIAGGIGITPILPIFRKLCRLGHPRVRLVYLTRSRETTAFLDELTTPGMGSIVTIHHTASGLSPRLDLWPFLSTPDDTHIYYCGPAPMMEAIYLKTIHWPRRNLHFEDFAGVSAIAPGSAAFKVRRASTGELIDIPSDKSVVEVFRQAGLKPRSSCETGTCGTCKVKLVAGDAHHRDLYLSPEERGEYFMPCVSRGIGELILDI